MLTFLRCSWVRRELNASRSVGGRRLAYAEFVGVLGLGRLALIVGFAGSIGLLGVARYRRALRCKTRRLHYFFAALLAFAAVPPLGVTGLFLFAYAGYCEDAGGPCAPDWWRPLGLALLIPIAVMIFVLGVSIHGFRRTRP
jgi:hypothetical protein